MTFVERSGEFETIGQHNDGLRAALAFNHRKPDRLGPVREQAAAQASASLTTQCPLRSLLLVGRQPNEQFRRQSESERDHQQQP